MTLELGILSTILSKPSQTTDVESSLLVMSSVTVGPSWWQMILGGWKNFFGGEIKSFDKMLLYGRRKVLHDMRVQALQQGFDEVINVRVETSMITKEVWKKTTGPLVTNSLHMAPPLSMSGPKVK